MSIELVQPFAERWANLVRVWRRDPDTVVLQASPETLLRVTYLRDSKVSPADLAQSRAGMSNRRWWEVRSSSDAPNIPIYFDFEAAWSRRIQQPTTVSYPMGLPKSPVGVGRPPQRDIDELVSKPFAVEPDEGSVLRARHLYLARRQRKILELGWVAHRVLPSLPDLPPYRGGRAERFVFLTGSLLAGKSLSELLGRLAHARQITPFLAASGGGRVLLGMLAPSPVRLATAGASAVELVAESLKEIEVVRESVDTFLPVIDHRYDRLTDRASDAPPK
ncbi:MAG: hypothetical protein L3K18_03575 [Thermoplasmata archaeon]|nr:hypothetical protein [Thermoplasmata archaeon]